MSNKVNDNNLRFDDNSSVKKIIKEYILIILASFLGTLIFYKSLWVKYTGLTHTIMELVCVFIAASTFMIVWQTYERNTTINKLIGFGFLAVAIFDSLHTYYFQGLNLYPLGFYDLATRYRVLGRVTEAIVLFLSISYFFKWKLNKLISLIGVLFITFSISALIYHYPNILPALSTSKGVTSFKIFIDYIFIGVFLVTLYKITFLDKRNNILTYRYIYFALLIAIPAEICFTFNGTISSFYSAMGHTLKLVYYYYLFRGIVVSAIIYPYDALETSKQDMNNILNELPLGLIKYDDKFRVTFINSKAEKVLGLSNSPIIGLSSDELIKIFYPGKEHRSHLVHQYLGTQNPLKNLILTVTNDKGTPSIINLDLIKNKTGGYINLIQEVKEEQGLKTLRLQTQTILNSISNLVVVLDQDKKVIMCNKEFERVTELCPQDILGFPLKELAERLSFIPKTSLINFSLTELNKVLEGSFVSSHGNKREVIIHSAPITDIDQETIGTIIVISDITEIKEEEKKVQQREKLAILGEMAAGIVHEIKNPLTTIKGFNQLLMMRYQNETNVKEYTDAIENEVQAINKVVSDFLNFAKPHPPSLREILLNELIDSMKLMLQTNVFIEGIDLEFKLAKDEKAILVDEVQIKQVILNIAKNAIDAMHGIKEPTLTITTAYISASKEMMLVITDNGKGISIEDQMKLGTPFYTTKDYGTGLGLSICYQMVKEHGGRIEIESELNKGSAFKIFIPCKAE